MNQVSNISEPFDPSLIEVEIKNFTIGTLVEMMRNDVIDLNPGFQRSGNVWPDEKRSQLIESLILGLPLPSFYFSIDPKTRKWVVIDGLQRLSTLKAFMIDKTLRLKNLEFLGDIYDSWDYDRFPYTDQLNMTMLTVSANLLKGSTPPDVKYIIFKRINTAGTQLTPQEIRNALNQGVATSFLLETAALPIFKSMVNAESKRMIDTEFILRFVAFTTGNYASYHDKMDLFLNDQMAELNNSTEEFRANVSRRFIAVLTLWNDVLGAMAFRNPTQKKKVVSKSLYDCLMVVGDELSAEKREALRRASAKFRENYIALFSDNDFNEARQSGTSKLSKINAKNRRMHHAIEAAINGLGL